MALRARPRRRRADGRGADRGRATSSSTTVAPAEASTRLPALRLRRSPPERRECSEPARTSHPLPAPTLGPAALSRRAPSNRGTGRSVQQPRLAVRASATPIAPAGGRSSSGERCERALGMTTSQHTTSLVWPLPAFLGLELTHTSPAPSRLGRQHTSAVWKPRTFRTGGR